MNITSNQNMLLEYDFETQVFTVKQGTNVLLKTESKMEAVDCLYELQQGTFYDNNEGNTEINVKPTPVKPVYF